ncbi:MAG: TM2 domain-containing protein [Clostridia bacterium]
MFCRNCGKEIEDSKEYCAECEATMNTKVVDEKVDVIKEVKNSTETVGTEDFTRKSKIAAGLFGIFFGAFGVHNFYLGYTGKAVAQLLITVLTCGILSPISGLWGLIEGILILSGDIDRDEKGNLLKS